MSVTFERPPDGTEVKALLPSGGFDSSPAIEAPPVAPTRLDVLPLGSHLVLRCRKDWRTATVVRIELEKITLSVNSPTGRTYRLRRPPDSPLTFHGSIPILGEITASCWRTGLVRYDLRW